VFEHLFHVGAIVHFYLIKQTVHLRLGSLHQLSARVYDRVAAVFAQRPSSVAPLLVRPILLH
jgi:hypothetical protein